MPCGPSFNLYLFTYTIMSILSIQTTINRDAPHSSGCHCPSAEEGDIKPRMLNQPLLTSISAQQDEAPVSLGFVVFLSYTLLSLFPTLPPFSPHSDIFIDGLSSLTMQVYRFVSSLPVFCLFLPHSPCPVHISASHQVHHVDACLAVTKNYVFFHS